MTASPLTRCDARDRPAASPESAELLEVSGLTISFGGIVALDSVSFSVAEGQIVGLIGPNGAGKTTLFNCLSRLYRPSAGEIRFAGHSLLDLSSHRVAGAGIGRTFQNLALFHSMSALDNTMAGAHSAGTSGFFGCALRSRSAQREERALREKARDMLALVGLEAVAQRPIESLAFGTRKRVELARALAGSPKLLLLDEPAGGLNHAEVAELDVLIRSIRDRLGVTMLLVEHHMGFVMGLSDKVVALDFGRILASGTPSEVRSSDAVIQAYLGGAH